MFRPPRISLNLMGERKYGTIKYVYPNYKIYGYKIINYLVRLLYFLNNY